MYTTLVCRARKQVWTGCAFFKELHEILDEKEKQETHNKKRKLTTHASREGNVMWKLQSIFGIAHLR